MSPLVTRDVSVFVNSMGGVVFLSRRALQRVAWNYLDGTNLDSCRVCHLILGDVRCPRLKTYVRITRMDISTMWEVFLTKWKQSTLEEIFMR